MHPHSKRYALPPLSEAEVISPPLFYISAALLHENSVQCNTSKEKFNTLEEESSKCMQAGRGSGRMAG
jgi:hypothetical protein